MATEDEKRIVKFYQDMYEKTKNPQYKVAAEYWAKKFGIKISKKKKKE